jgi:hypothetical protein
MKKIIYLFILLFCFVSCQNSSKPDVESLKENIVFFKKGNLCFAAVNSDTYGYYTISSITCVPCDSLKNTRDTISWKEVK